MNDGIVIAGGGLAAQRCCETLRAKGYDGPVRVVCAEPLPPYDRPPLSKELLAGELPDEALLLRPRSWYEQRGVDLLLGVSAARLRPAERALELSDGRELRYGSLLVATGSEPRMLPSLEGFENVQALRTLADARALRAELGAGTRLAVVGAGFIGLEVAATARRLGAEVTLIEAAPTPLVAVLGPRLGAWFADLHRDEGVEVLLSAGVEGARGRMRATDLLLAGGRRVRCDRIVVGVGVRPATQWLAGSGLDSGGPAVDTEGRTGAPDIYAAGDAARVWDPGLARHVRTEHWEAAARQGAGAARAMLGLDPALAPPPSFWSDQYGLRVQYVGHGGEADRIVLDGDPAARDFQAGFTRDGVPVAALLVGRPRALPEARRRVHAGLTQLQMQATATDTR